MKRFILLSLLAVAPLLSNIKDIDLSLESLMPAQLKKAEELSIIRKKITEKQAILKELDDQAEYLFNSSIASYDELVEALNLFVAKFERIAKGEKSIKGLLAEGFSVGQDYEFDFIKVFLVIRYFERLIMVELVRQYEMCLNDFLEMLR